MGKYRKGVQIIILAAVVVVGGLTIMGGLFSKHAYPKVGDAAPDFALVGLDGQVHHLSDYKGRTVMVNFWGTYCPPCKREMPAIQKQYAAWKNQGLEVLGVNVEEGTIAVKSFADQYGLSFPIVLDEKSEIRKHYGVMDYPTTFFIRPDGTIAEKRVGEMDEAYIKRTLSALLGKQGGSAL